MSDYLRQSTAVTVKLGPFLDDTDGKTAETALTLSQADFRLSKNGGDFSQKNESTSGVHDEIGYYDVAINATDTNTLGHLLISVHKSGSLPVWKEFTVLPALVYDSLVAGTDNLQVDLLQILGTTLTETSGGYLAAAFKKFLDVASPVFTAAAVNQTGDSYTRIGANGVSLTSIPALVNNAGVKIRQITPEAADTIVKRFANALISEFDDGDTVLSRLKPVHSGYAQGGDEVAWAGGYSAISTGSGNFSGGSGRRRTAIQLGHYTRIMQAGAISELDIYTHVVPAELKVSVWRYNGVGYDRIGQTENFAIRCTAATTNRIMLEQPITGVKEGDYYGFELYSTSSCLKVLTGESGSSSIYYWDDTIIDEVGVALSGGTSQSGWILPIRFYMKSPGFVAIGDSITAGHNVHYSYQETTATNSPSSSYPYQLGTLNGLTYQNRGIGSQTSTSIEARFITQVVDLSPGFVVINCGVNDIAGIADPTNAGQVSSAKTTYLAKIDSMLSLAAAASIPVVLVKIIPWTNGTNNQHVVRNDWNASLASRASSVVLVVDLDSTLGQFKSGGLSGNHDDILTAYNADGVHLNATGYAAMATGINTAIEADATFEALCLGTSGAATLVLSDDAISGTTPYDNCQVQIVSGTGAGQIRRIDSQSSRTATVDRNWDTRPDRTSFYKIVPCTVNETELAATKTVTDQLADTLQDSGGGNFVFTADALANGPTDGTPPTVGEIRAEMDSNSTKLANLDVAVSTRLATAGYTAPDNSSVASIKSKTDNLPSSPAAVGSPMTLADGAITEAKLADGVITNAKVADDLTVGSVTNGVTLAASTDVYHADIHLDIDDANDTDEYTVSWFKNGVPLTSGITSPTIQVIKRTDGTDLQASTAMIQVGSTGVYKKDCTTTTRITAGEAVAVLVGAMIGGSARSFIRVIGRDSEEA